MGDNVAFKTIIDAILQGNIPVVQQHLRGISDINALGDGEQTLLHAAAKKGNPFIIQLLLNRRGNPQSVDKQQRTPIMIAIENQNIQAFQSLRKQGATLLASDTSGLNCLHYTAKYGNLDILNDLLSNEFAQQINETTPHGVTALHFACYFDKSSLVKELLQKNADINALINEKYSALDIAICKNNDEIIKILNENSPPPPSIINEENKEKFTEEISSIFGNKEKLGETNEKSIPTNATTTESEKNEGAPSTQENGSTTVTVDDQNKEENPEQNEGSSGETTEGKKSKKGRKREKGKPLEGMAIYPFNKIIFELETTEKDLFFEAGEIIKNIQKSDEFWWEGEIGENSGYFPNSYVSTEILFTAKVLYDFKPRYKDEIEIKKGEIVRVYQNKNTWYRGITETAQRGGLFPANHVIMTSDPKIDSIANPKVNSDPRRKGLHYASKGNVTLIAAKNNPIIAHSTGSIPSPRSKKIATSKKPLPKAKVLSNYSIQHPGDLELVAGTIIELTKTSGGWWEGIYSGNRGIFPANLVERIDG